MLHLNIGVCQKSLFIIENNNRFSETSSKKRQHNIIVVYRVLTKQTYILIYFSTLEYFKNHSNKSNIILGRSEYLMEDMVYLAAPPWSGCPCGFMHCVVFPGLWQGLALICGPDCGSSAGAARCWGSRGSILPRWTSPFRSVLRTGNI